jgi:hypothetical protein
MLRARATDKDEAKKTACPWKDMRFFNEHFCKG